MHLDSVPLNKCCSYDIFKIVFSIPANISECHIFQLSVNVLIYCLQAGCAAYLLFCEEPLTNWQVDQWSVDWCGDSIQ